jgi:hypothetical protein
MRLLRVLPQMGQSIPDCAIRDMSVRHPIADMRADIAGRRFGPGADILLFENSAELTLTGY